VVKEGPKVTQLIQVCWNVEDARTKDRELRSLVKGMEELKASRSLVVTEGYEAEEEFKGARIAFVPLWKWLLG